MKTFTLILRDATHVERFQDVTSLVAEDASGSFGILAGHERMMTILVFGLARFRLRETAWRYLALPGGVLYAVGDEVSISTRRFLIGEDYENISAALQEQLLLEESNLKALKKSLHSMDQEVLQRMWAMGREWL